MSGSEMRVRVYRSGWATLAAVLITGCVSLGGPKAAYELRELLPGNMRYDAKGGGELVIDFPAMDVPAGLGYADGGVTRTMQVAAPFDAWVHGYTIEVVDSAGRVLGNGLLHHMNILGPDQRELFEPIMLHIVAAGMETEEVRTPRRIGYPIRRVQPLMLVAMLHNPGKDPLSAVRVRARLPVTVATAPHGRIEAAFPFHLQVTEPGMLAEFDVPPGRSTQVREARPAISGRIMALGGHLHQFGVSVKLEDVAANRVIWTGVAERDAEGNVVQIPTASFGAAGVRIEAGRVYRITSEYNNTSGELKVAGGMGSLGGVFIPDSGVSWPAVDVNDPVYQRDYAMRFGAHAKHVHR